MTAIKAAHSGDNAHQLRISHKNHTQNDFKEQARNKKNVSATELSFSDPALAERKANAKKQAMNVVTQAFGKEQRIDEAARNVEGDIVRRLNKLPELEEKSKDAAQSLAELRDRHGVKKGDETDEELMRLACEIYDGQKSGESGSAWVRRERELWSRVDNHESAYVREGIHEAITLIESTDDIYTNKGVIKLEHQALSDLDRERLADTSMRDAMEKAKDIEDASSRDTILQAVGDVKDGMDEEQEEIDEEIEEIREERRLREKEEDKDDPLDVGVLQSEEALRMQQTQAAVVSEVEMIVNRMSLIKDDIKGIEIDDLL